MTRTGSSKADRAAARPPEQARLRRIYSRYAGSARKRRAWAPENPGNRAIRAELLALIGRLADRELEGQGKVLDVGCGTGWLLAALADSGVAAGRLHGVDLLADRVAAAAEAVPGAEVRCEDARALDLPGGGFALVLMLTTLSSLSSGADVRRALAEARRVAAPGGLVLIYEPRIPNPLNPSTRLIRDGDLAAAGLAPHDDTTLTVHPWLARRLGANTQARYERLARLRALRSHRLIAYRVPPPPGSSTGAAP